MNSLTTPAKLSSVENDTSLIVLSQKLLYAVRTEDSSEAFVQQLSRADHNELYKQLSTDEEKKAFWLNIYNAFVQKILSENPGKYKKRHSFFSDKQITIAGRQLSLDDIEHGILRRSKIKWGLGHLNKIFPSAIEKKFRVDRLDYRIHFALNCGAKSCPPVAFYAPEKIDQQLELAAKNYLSSEVDDDKTSGTVSVPAIMSWFRADFGGKKGIRKILNKYRMIKVDNDIKIHFKKYDWNLYLNNYTSNDNE